MNKPKALPLSEWSDPALEAQMEILRGTAEQIHELMLGFLKEKIARLGFADEIPAYIFMANAPALIEGFRVDPRSFVITVPRTDQSCILKPANLDDLPEESEPISRMGQYGRRIIQRVFDSRVRMGIRRGGGRNAYTVAELCPPNQDSDAYLAILKEIKALPSFSL